VRIIGTTYPANQAGAALDYRRLTTATISDPLSRLTGISAVRVPVLDSAGYAAENPRV
jgi:hypothetical protein